ncbi:MAG: hypothetical protein PVG83_12255, partial [Acidimicrobiia bacterium]
MDLAPVFLIGALYVLCAYVCFQKGKMTFGWLTLAGLIPFLAPLGIFGIVGALRYAKPNSAWAHTRYDPAQLEAARRRFPGVQAPAAPPTVSSGQIVTEPTKIEPAPDDTGVIIRFVGRAYEAGIIDRDTRFRLVDFLDRGQAAPETTETPIEKEVVAPPPTPPAAPVGPPRAPAPEPPVSVPAPPPPAPREPARPPSPPTPSPVSAFFSRTWDAIASDVALHGFAYLGVAVTFIGVLGFLLFAFADLPDAVQPFIELFIALIFFGWAWMLRRQQAEHVADGMELIGGMVLPLILFAGLVDSAPFPPDFTGNALVVALTVSSLLIALAYAWVSSRNPESTLRYLVGPLVWLGALTSGFFFKTDEPLASDAITRLVSPQPALAAAAISLTLLACLARRGHRLAAPTIRSSLVGVPAAYLLTVSMTAGEDWSRLWPLVILGAATFVSAEVLAVWFDRREWMVLARPILLAGVLAPMEPSLGMGWTGLVVVISYVALHEWARRRVGSDT